MAVNKTELAETQRQVAVAVYMCLVDKHTARAVHRLYRVILTVNLSEVHIFLVMIPMSGSFPQLAVHNHRSLDFLIAVTAVNLTPVVYKLVSDNHSVRVEEREAGTLFVQAEKIQLLAKLSVVAFCSFLQHVQIFRQVFFLLEGRTVDTLQHLIFFVSTPVSACNTLQLECLHLTRGNNVRACAQICEISLLVNGNKRVLRKIVNKLYLVALSFFFKELQRIRTADFLADHRNILLYNAVHFLLNVFKVAVCKLFLHVDIVVEAVFNRRSDSELDSVLCVKMLESLRHDMCCRVAECPTAILILKCEELYLCVLRNRCHKVNGLAVHLCRENLLRETVGYLFYEFKDSRAVLNTADAAVLKFDVCHSELPPVML